MRLVFIFFLSILFNLNPSFKQGAAIVNSNNEITPETTAKKAQRLFVIERNMNKNTVCYDAIVLPGGKLDANNPIDAYWIDYATTGKRSELNFIQRKMAYGFKIEKSAAGSVYVTLSAFAKKKMLVLPDAKGNVKALMKINNIDAQLTKIFVSAKPKAYTSVEYVELFGTDIRTGKQVYEKIQNF